MEMERRPLQFAPFSSFLDGGFWHKLSSNKLNVYGLDDSVKPVHGFYFNGDQPGMPCRMTVDHSSFDLDEATPSRCFRTTGCLYNTNTMEDFKEKDKKTLLDTLGSQVTLVPFLAPSKIWQSITNGAALENPNILLKFLLLTHADLKKYHYYYWFAFPCLCPEYDFIMIQSPQTITQTFTQEQLNQLIERYNTYQSGQSTTQAYFIVVVQENGIVIDHLKNANKYISANQKVIFAFADPCTLDQHPGWPLRNFLALVSYYWGSSMSEVDILCFRYQSKAGVHDINHSLLLSVKLSTFGDASVCPKCVGWEKNERQKLGPRMVNLSASMDPSRLAESAVDLNLKLMRWRLLPDLDLQTIAQTKCLLLGAGTLGCNVARCLLGWGVRNITLVDNGRVSFSNPVRQTLFVFDDCTQPGGGKPKAQAAAESLQKIFPGVNAVGVSMSIPMPGHSVSGSAVSQVKADVEQLAALVSSHDAVFLLLDTRESRWMPTVMAASMKKTVICSALGFDTFLVMRHGFKTDNSWGTEPFDLSQYRSIPGDQLGCYFCNDVVAPGDSTRDRTLDQQCTVSRPGMSFIASALAVELLVSVLQHPEKGCAQADTSANDEHLTKDHASPLGLVPHQIRGFLSRFQQIMPASRAFDKCTACSQTVVDHYEKEGFEFLLKVFNNPNFLEDLTGLTKMHEETANAEVWDFEDDEDFASMDSN